MKKFVLIAPKNRTVYNFRGDLIRRVQALGYHVTVIGPDRTDIDRVLALGVDFVEVPVNKSGVNPLGDMRYLRLLTKALRRIRPDATLGYTIKPSIYGALAARLAGVRNVTSMVTGVGYLFTSRSFKARLLKLPAKALYRAGLAAANHVIFQNPDDRADFLAAGLVRESKTRVVNGSGVNMERFTPAPLPEGPLTVLTISRALRSKGAMEFLEAARIVKARRPDIRIQFLGTVDESMSDSLRRADIDRAVADGVIEQFGETHDVRPFIAGCSVMVLASHREGTPRTVLEAMAMGRPVITTDAPGCRQTVIDGLNGLLAVPRSSASLAQAILDIASMPRERLEEMGRESLRLCRERFDVNIVNDAMIDYMELG